MAARARGRQRRRTSIPRPSTPSRPRAGSFERTATTASSARSRPGRSSRCSTRPLSVAAAGSSTYYAEPKRLERLGYLHSHKEPGKTRARTHYSLTLKGLKALREYLAEPAPFPRMQNEPALRLLAGDLTDDKKTVQSLRGLLRELDELEAELAEVEKVTAEIPHRARYLALSHRLPRKLIAAHREWAEDVISDLEGSIARPADSTPPAVRR
jgi:DNA-binding PadR family transcriptional regulator